MVNSNISSKFPRSSLPMFQIIIIFTYSKKLTSTGDYPNWCHLTTRNRLNFFILRDAYSSHH
jgi:hypothetical protein